MFNESFKYYKSKCFMPDFSNVIDYDYCRNPSTLIEGVVKLNKDTWIELPTGVQPVRQWRCYTLPNHPGLLLLRNPFNSTVQRYWIARCLRDYPRRPSVVNLNARLFAPTVISDWWGELHCCTNPKEARRIKNGMRWSTLGYHHDWNTKVYSDQCTAFPDDLGELCKFFARALGFENFMPQAAIVNYYPIGTTLAGHTDHSEVNLKAPLFSFSFGQTAIFLIGGSTKAERPTALYLRSGDVLVMSQEARLCYHAVPRVMKASVESWNIAGPPQMDNYSDLQPNATWHMDKSLWQQVQNEAYWAPFQNYLEDSRINVNVRQVLPNGDTHRA